MTTDAAIGAASSASGMALPASDTGSPPAASSAANAAASATGVGVMGPLTASHTRVDTAPALPVSNGTASSVVIGSAVPSMGAGAMLQAVFGLAVVIALVFACGWVARRLGLKPSTRRGGIVKVVGSAALGARERVVVVEVRDTWLVLGVAAGSVRRLHTLPADATAHGLGETGTASAVSGDDNGSDTASRTTVAGDANANSDAPRDALPSFQSALARQLKDRLNGFGRSGHPGGKD